MLIAVDVGNSNITCGIYDEENLIYTFRIATDKNKTNDEYGILITSLLRSRGVGIDIVDGAIIASVVPMLTSRIKKSITKYLGVNAIVVSNDMDLGVNITCSGGFELGVDRFVNAVAAYRLYGGPLIIIGFGTATTFCAVTERADYIGGLICPGINMLSDAIHEKTAQLPRVEIVKPSAVIGQDTITNIQAGLVYGLIGQVTYIIAKMKAEMNNPKAKVVATGGLSKIICGEIPDIDIVNEFLILEGLKIIFSDIKSKEQ